MGMLGSRILYEKVSIKVSGLLQISRSYTVQGETSHLLHSYAISILLLFLLHPASVLAGRAVREISR